MLQYHYNVPNFRLHFQFGERRRFDYHIESFFDIEISSIIDSLDALTNDSISEYQILVSFSDDFGYYDADRTFNEADRLVKVLINESNSQGYNTTVKYSDPYQFLKLMKTQNLTFGQFKGDFLPYQETYNGQTDFWSGYYSTKLHLRRQIMHLYNDLQATKLLLAIRVLSKYKGIANLKQKVYENIENINKIIIKAEAT